MKDTTRYGWYLFVHYVRKGTFFWIRFLLVLQKFFLKQRFHFPRTSISLSIANSFRGFINTPERFEIIHHLAVFVSRLWQIHIFGEGNTRTTAVFFIKYLRTLGFSATNDIFAENAWYFRNALVRANYTNLRKGIHETTEYLEAFLRNLLLNEKNELHNRNLHISGLLNEEKVDIEDAKVDIQDEKVDIQDKKVDIESVLSEKGSDFSVKTTVHIHRLFEKFGFDEVFGRSAVMELLELKSSGASKLLANLAQADIIEPVSGRGKGKYKFKKGAVKKE